MDYKEAYRRLKQKIPGGKAGGYKLYRDQLFVFNIVPVDYVYQDGDICDTFYSVDKDTGVIKPFFPAENILEFAHSPGGKFDEKDIL